MKYGMADELKKLYHTRNKGIPTIIDVFENPDDLLEKRPCAFDEVGDYIDGEDVKEEYEPED
jgi:hypothetical protein